MRTPNGKWLLAVVVVAALSSVVGSASSQQRSARIDGIWTVTFFGRNNGNNKLASGQIALLTPTRPMEPRWMSLGSPSQVGVFSIDLVPIGGAETDSSRVATVGAKVNNDSVTIVLNPAQDHGAVIMRGVLRRKIIAGTWVTTSYGPMESGTFRMTEARGR